MTDATLQQLTAAYGTPTFVFDVDALQARVRAIQEVFGPDIKLCYSIKANPFLLPAMSTVTARLEVCSPGELSVCESLQAADARVIYSGVNKTPADIARAVADGAGSYTAESLLQVRYLQEAARAAGRRLPVLLRLNAGSQFGMSKQDLFSALKNRAETPDLDFIGIHYFVGTQRKKLTSQQKELTMLQALYDEIEQTFGLRLPELEYGPGLPVPYFDGDDFTDTLAPARALAPALQEATGWAHLTVEMGRFYTAECGFYLTTAMDCKDHDGQHYCIVDGGMNHLNYLGQIMGMKRPHLTVEMGRFYTAECGFYLTTAMDCKDHDGQHYCIVDGGMNHLNYLGQIMGMKRPHLRHFAAQQGTQQDWTLCGSLCTTNDVLVRSISLTGLQPGDLLVFENAGAYSVTEGLGLFLSRDLPQIVLWQNGAPQLVRALTPTHPLNTPLGDM